MNEDLPDDEAPTTSPASGPHLWLNWQAQRADQPARKVSKEDGDILVRPCWEEASLFSDAHISGEFEDGPFKLINALGGVRIPGEARQMFILRSADHLISAKPEAHVPAEPDLDGWTGGDFHDQFAALLSLAIARRMRSGGITRQAFTGAVDDDPLGRPMSSFRVRPTLLPSGRDPIIPGLSSAENIGDHHRDLLRGYSELDADHARALTRAASQYSDALWWADADPRSSWMKLVGAAETAANHWDQSTASNDPVDLLQRHRPRLARKLESISEEALRVVARDLSGTQKAEAKFLDFMLRFSPEPPPTRPPVAMLDYGQLEAELRCVYEWRSRDLHDGIPLPAPICEPPHPVDGVPVEVFPALAVSQAGGAWPAGSLPMYLHVLAYLVGGALRAWWNELLLVARRDASKVQAIPAPETPAVE